MNKSDIKKAINDAYYTARNEGRVMDVAADMATDAVMDLFRAEKAEEAIDNIPDRSIYRPEKGERVRVVLEGEVQHVWRNNLRFDLGTNTISIDAPHVVSVVKVKPSVVTFQPGQRVRDKRHPKFEFTLGVNGYYDHSNKRVATWSGPFSSKHFELVEE